jgi:hypothetical protein
MTTIRPTCSPNAIENFDYDVETIPDSANSNLPLSERNKWVLKSAILIIGLAGTVIIFTVLGVTHSL